MDCPNNQVYRERIRRCGTTCETYANAEYCKNAPLIDVCSCEDGLVLNVNVSMVSIMYITIQMLDQDR